MSAEVVLANAAAKLFGTDIIDKVRDSRSPIDLLAVIVPWWAKVALLLAGLRYKTLGLVYLILDGRFHWTASAERLKQESPDWILADLLGLKGGLGVTAHRVMGLRLMLGSAWALLPPRTSHGFLCLASGLHNASDLGNHRRRDCGEEFALETISEERGSRGVLVR